MIALVCIAAWANCVYRARLFRNSVAHYHDSNPINVDPGATTIATTTNGASGGSQSSSIGNNHEFATATITPTAAAGTRIGCYCILQYLFPQQTAVTYPYCDLKILDLTTLISHHSSLNSPTRIP